MNRIVLSKARCEESLRVRFTKPSQRLNSAQWNAQRRPNAARWTATTYPICDSRRFKKFRNLVTKRGMSINLSMDNRIAGVHRATAREKAQG